MMDARQAATPVTRAVLSMQMFGTVRLLADGLDITPKSRKARALLVYLALTDSRGAARERIAFLLWSDRGDNQARASLRQTVSELREGPLDDGNVLRISRDWLALAPDAVATDIAAIYRAADRRDLTCLAGLLEACDGEFLDGLGAVSPAFDEWLQVERTRHVDQTVNLILAATEAALESAAKVDINAILSALERLDPANEHILRLGLRADHLAGDTASLHRRYRRLNDQLAREFGIKPSEESRALFQDLSTAAPAAVRPTRRDVPTRGVASALTEAPVIMVSPLVAVDNHEETTALAEMCTDDIRVALGQFSDLRVLALENVDPAFLSTTVSGSLAGYVLSGKLRHADTDIRINIKLANITSGLVVWTEQLRVSPGALGAAVDRIVLRAAGAVMPAIERDLAGLLVKSRPASDDIVLLYAHARHAVRTARTHAEARAGGDLLESVIGGDPRHVDARLALARLYNSDFWQTIAGHDSAAFRTRAFDLVLDAAAIEPHNPRVQLRLAWCHLRRRAWQLAERGLENALALLPHDADVMNEVANGFWHLGDLDRAEAIMQRAFQLNPFPPADYHADFALIPVLRRDAQSAEQHFAVSGETGLLYRMLRLANAWYLTEDGDLTRDLALGVRRDFAAIWQRPAPPKNAEIVDWLGQWIVLRQETDWAFVSNGLLAGLNCDG